MSRPTARPPVRHFTRRTALGGALAGLTVLTSCELDVGPGDPAPTTEIGADDPDAALVEAVADDIVATSVLVAALRRRHRTLRPPLAELARMHDAHRKALGPGERSVPRPPPTADAAAALAVLRRREQHHRQLLAERALSARSGRLARLLASMSAAVAQQLAVLPDGRAR